MTPDPLILVVDDLPQNVRLLDAVLSPHGFRVATASSGKEALDVLGKKHPDLVLLDILMPGIDGIEALRRLRESPRTVDIPVVAVTAQAMKQDRERALEAGFDGYVEKPISVRAFPGLVRRFLSDEEVETQ